MMKTIKLFLLLAITTLVTFSCAKTPAKSRAINPATVAVFYSADDANQIAGAAVCAIKYAHCTLFNIDNMTTSNQLTAIQTITDSVHRVIILTDTATVWATNKLTGAQYDSLTERLFTVVTNTVTPDATPTLIAASATKNKCEVLWAALYPTYTLPLALQYLGDDVFSALASRTRKVNTDSTALDSTLTLVADAYNGDWIYIYDGTGIGQYREIYDGDDSLVYVSPDWTTQPDETSLYKIKNDGEEGEIFNDMYTQCYVLTRLRNLSDNQTMTNWHKLVDANYNINDGNVKNTPYQDMDYLNNTVLVQGKTIFDFSVNATDQ